LVLSGLASTAIRRHGAVQSIELNHWRLRDMSAVARFQKLRVRAAFAHKGDPQRPFALALYRRIAGVRPQTAAHAFCRQYLGLRQNYIPAIEGLEPLTELRTLELRDNNLERLEKLDTLTKLEQVMRTWAARGRAVGCALTEAVPGSWMSPTTAFATLRGSNA
jgi:hypothetical protein